jgi:hypothetical protein
VRLRTTKILFRCPCRFSLNSFRRLDLHFLFRAAATLLCAHHQRSSLCIIHQRSFDTVFLSDSHTIPCEVCPRGIKIYIYSFRKTSPLKQCLKGFRSIISRFTYALMAEASFESGRHHPRQLTLMFPLQFTHLPPCMHCSESGSKAG